MTFTEIVNTICARLGFTTPESIARVGAGVNTHYKRVTSELGIQVGRQVLGVIGTASIGVQELTFEGIEKIDWLIDDRSGSRVVIYPKTLKEIRSQTPAATDATPEFAILRMGPNSVTVLLNTLPQTAYELKADGLETAEILSGSQVPQFSESFHDILIERVIADERRDQEKELSAKTADAIATTRTSQLKLFIARAGALVRQGLTAAGATSSGASAGGGSGISGGTSWTQTGLITFMRGVLAPFAVQAGAAVVPNLDADMVDGQHASDILAAAAAAAGDVDGPASSTDNAIPRFVGTGGKTLENTGMTIPDGASGSVNGVNTGDVTLGGSPDYITIAGQVITRALINLTSHVTNRLPYANLVAATAASRFLARTSASAGDWQEGSFGTGLEMQSTVLQLVLPSMCQGRLTLTTGVPVTTTDVTGATTMYFTPYKGNKVSLYDGSNWKLYTFTERSLALGTLTSGRPYDVFLYDNAGTLTLEFTAWTNDTTRATALTTQDGVYVKTGALTRRYLGTFYTTSTTQTEDSYAKRFVWNYYNRVDSPMRVLEATTSWTYTTATIRQANGSTANQLDMVIGVAEDSIDVAVDAHVSNDTGGTGTPIAVVAIGEDSTTAAATGSIIATKTLDQQAAAAIQDIGARLRTIPAVGRHFYAWLEYSTAGTGVTTWYGDNNTPTLTQSGITGMGKR